jgi:hypothetical protein
MTFARTSVRLRLEPVASRHVRELTRLAAADRLDDELARAIPYCTGEEWLEEIALERAEGSAEVYVAVTDNGEIAGGEAGRDADGGILPVELLDCDRAAS